MADFLTVHCHVQPKNLYLLLTMAVLPFVLGGRHTQWQELHWMKNVPRSNLYDSK